MKFLAIFLFLMCGHFTSMFVIGKITGWYPDTGDIAFTSIIFGVLGTAVTYIYLRYIRKKET